MVQNTMDAVDGNIDTLGDLEERIHRAVQVITELRGGNEQTQQRLKNAEEELRATRADRDEAKALLAEFQKENSDLEGRIKQLTAELEELRGERKQVRTRIEKLLTQLDLLSAS